MSGAIRLALGLLLSAAACGGSAKGTGRSADSGSLRLVLSAVDGGEIDLARYRGRVVVLHLFSTDSTAAASDADELGALSEKRREQVTVIGVCLDPEGYPMAAAWRRAVGARYLVALADPGVLRGTSPLGTVRVVPTTIVLDGSGRVVHRIERPLQPGEIAERVADLVE